MRLVRISHAVWLAWLAMFVLPSAATASPAGPALVAQDKGVHEDAQFGFKFRPPKEWTRIPLKLEERWQVAKYLSDRPYFYTDKTEGWTYEHKPQLLVIAFVSELVRQEARAKREKKEGQDRISILIENPFKDYLDYLKRTYSGGGYYVSDQQETKIDDLDVTQYEIKVEKLTRDGPKRIVCWVYHTKEVDFAVHVEVLEDAWPKLKKELTTTLRSFKLIPRTEGGLPTASTGETVIELDESEKTPEQRKQRRIELEKNLHAKARESVPDGWQVMKIGRFLVLNHSDEKYAKRVAEHGDALLGWMEQTFPFIGPEEYVRQPILRICKDRDEEMSFHDGGGFFWFGENRIEVVTSQDNNGFVAGWAVERINRQLVDLWFVERDRDLYWAMPGWLRMGLYQVIGTARAKGDKIEFRKDDWERDGVRERIREGKVTKPRDFLKMTASDYTGGDEWWGRDKEAGSLLRFFVSGPGAKNPKTKDVLRDYIRNLKAVVTEIAAERKAKKGDKEKPPANEAEEEARFKAQSESWKKEEKRVLDATYERTFRSWTDKDWDAFEEFYFKSVD
jgi:hypothetical protein